MDNIRWMYVEIWICIKNEQCYWTVTRKAKHMFYYTTATPQQNWMDISYELYLLCKDAPSTVDTESPKPVGYDSTDGDPSAKWTYKQL